MICIMISLVQNQFIAKILATNFTFVPDWWYIYIYVNMMLYMSHNMIHVAVVTVKTAWWLLMAWHLHGARPSATTVLPYHLPPMSHILTIYDVFLTPGWIRNLSPMRAVNCWDTSIHESRLLNGKTYGQFPAVDSNIDLYRADAKNQWAHV